MCACMCMWGCLEVRGALFKGNQLRPHARNMLIGIRASAVTASHLVLTTCTFLPVATAPGPSEIHSDVSDKPVHCQKCQGIPMSISKQVNCLFSLLILIFCHFLSPQPLYVVVTWFTQKSILECFLL